MALYTNFSEVFTPMPIDENKFERLTELCHIQCSAEEKIDLFLNLSKILSYVELLNEIGTEDIEPCDQVLKTVHNVLREDVVGKTLPREEFLANAPSHIGGMVKVPSILNIST